MIRRPGASGLGASDLRVTRVGHSTRSRSRRLRLSADNSVSNVGAFSIGPSAPSSPKGRDGAAEAIRALMVAKRSAPAERTQTISAPRGYGRVLV